MGIALLVVKETHLLSSTLHALPAGQQCALSSQHTPWQGHRMGRRVVVGVTETKVQEVKVHDECRFEAILCLHFLSVPRVWLFRERSQSLSVLLSHGLTQGYYEQ